MTRRLSEKLMCVLVSLLLVMSLCPATGIAQDVVEPVDTDAVTIEAQDESFPDEAVATDAADASEETVSDSSADVGEGEPEAVPEAVEEVSEAVVADDEPEPAVAAVPEEVAESVEAVTEEEPAEAEGVPFSGELSASAGDAWVSVSADERACLPSDSELSMTEVDPDSNEYKAYLAALVETLGEDEAREVEARFFDVSILSAEGEVEPSAAVDVRMGADDVGTGSGVVHFAGTDEVAEHVEVSAEAGAVSFSTESFSVYGIYRYSSSGMTEDLDGKAFAIGNANPANEYVAFVSSQGKSPGLASVKGYTRFHAITFPSDAASPAVWTFHALSEVGEADGLTQEVLDDPANVGILYALSTEVDGVTKWMGLGRSSMGLFDTPQPLRVMAGSGNYAGQVMVRRAHGLADDTYRLNLKSGNVSLYFQGSNWNPINQNDWHTLYAVEDLEIVAENEQVSANKASVSSLVDGDEVVIYHSVWDSDANSYVQLAVNGYGDLVMLTDEGGTVAWYEQYAVADGHKVSCVTWRFVEGRNEDGTPSGYYWFQNVETGAYLSPRALFDFDGEKYAEVILPGDGIEAGTEASFDYSVQLPGRDADEFVSSIIAWSYRGGTEALRIVDDPSAPMGHVVTKGLFGDADTFNFAVVSDREMLTTKQTLDSTAMGVQIRMYDFRNRAYMNGLIGSRSIQNISGVKRSWFVPGLVEPVLDDGVPVSAATGIALDGLFGEDVGVDANHLFLESIYDETGYFEYNSAQNYAYFNQDGEDAGNFTVYNQLGSPQGNNATVRGHGHFMPYSKLLEEVWAERNTLNQFAQPLAIDDPRYGDVVHKIERDSSFEDNYNYSFGMTVETTFMQTLTKTDMYGNDSILEFTGDDDLWVFVDDVLVLDLGGIHSAVSGKINFTTGEISYGNFVPKSADGTDADVALPPTTIRACFEVAGVFPDGSAWDDARADDYFDGDTLRSSYSGHSMKLFYLERGGNSSNIHTRFNLRTVRGDAALVGKVVSGTRKQEYMDKGFSFQAFLADGTPLREATLAKLGRDGEWVDTGEPIEPQTVTIGNVTYENVFVLSHGEGAYFPLEDDDMYYAREIGISDDQVEEVVANDDLISVTRSVNAGDESLVDVSVGSEMAARRRQVVFDNEMKSSALRITKRLDLAAGQRPDPNLTFQFRVKVGPDEDHLRAYSVQPYYVRDEQGRYCTRVNGRIYPLTRRDDGTYFWVDKDGVEHTIANRDATDPVFDYSSQTGYIDYVLANHTIEIQGMLEGMVFSVEETSVPSGYELESIVDGEDSSFEHLSEDGASVVVGRCTAEDAEVVATNLYSEGRFRLVKVSSEDGHKRLSGAKFELYMVAPECVDGKPAFHPYDVLARFESDANGYLRVVAAQDEDFYGGDTGSADLSLAAGTYYLRETAAPLGYLLKHPVSAFSIDEDGRLSVLGLVEFDENGQMIYTSQDNLMVGEDTTIGSVVLQTGMISNVPVPVPPPTGIADEDGSDVVMVVLPLVVALGWFLVSRRKRLAT